MNTHTKIVCFLFCIGTIACGEEPEPEPQTESWIYCVEDQTTVTIKNHNEIQQWAQKGCNAFGGGLVIQGEGVTDLSGMEFLEHIDGQFTLFDTGVENLAPLVNVKSIKISIDISSNNRLPGCQASGFANAFSVPSSLEFNSDDTDCLRRPGT
jgi:hypothetical protein